MDDYVKNLKFVITKKMSQRKFVYRSLLGEHFLIFWLSTFFQKNDAGGGYKNKNDLYNVHMTAHVILIYPV